MDRPISKFKSFRRAPALISILTARIKEPLLRKQQQRQYRNAVITITMLNMRIQVMATKPTAAMNRMFVCLFVLFGPTAPSRPRPPHLRGF